MFLRMAVPHQERVGLDSRYRCSGMLVCWAASIRRPVTLSTVV